MFDRQTALQLISFPGSLIILAGFGLVYGYILHAAIERQVYRITGVRVLDSWLLSWLLGLAATLPPLFLYLAFGFKEFSDTPVGNTLLRRLRIAARLEVAYLVLYGALVLLLVPQK
jgi:hypothetical protein